MSTGVKFVVVPKDPSAETEEVRNKGPKPECSIGKYSHILVIYDDGSYGLVAAVYGAFGVFFAKDVARELAMGLPVEIDPDFYKKQQSPPRVMSE